ncbi:MAG: hypothetical protein JWN70_663 [Planctomycetaceae bacterium]|nr:hypothetical protein [Planctomycetaceae bacterium]
MSGKTPSAGTRWRPVVLVYRVGCGAEPSASAQRLI